jgi:hypothetical protein
MPSECRDRDGEMCESRSNHSLWYNYTLRGDLAMRIALSVFLTAFFLVANPLNAQEKGKLGLTLPGIGVIWHVTKDFAIRPNLGFSWFSTTAGNGSQYASDSDGSSFTASVAGLFYLHSVGDLNFYLCPRYSYRRYTTDQTSVSPSQTMSYTTTNTGNGIAGLWGLEYALTKRLTVFGEIGLGYTRTKTTTTLPFTLNPTTHGNDLSTTAGFGLHFYLN